MEIGRQVVLSIKNRPIRELPRLELALVNVFRPREESKPSHPLSPEAILGKHAEDGPAEWFEGVLGDQLPQCRRLEPAHVARVAVVLFLIQKRNSSQ